MANLSHATLDAVRTIRSEAFQEAAQLIMDRHDSAPLPPSLKKLPQFQRLAILDLLEELADAIWALGEDTRP
jgi:hypothetical protein